MKINLKISVIIALGTILLFSHNVWATVGGSLVLYDFKYNPGDESIYYIELDGGGRGCPPVLKKISLLTKQTETIFSCEDGESLTDYNWENRHLVYQKINEITNQFKDLIPISLKKNNVVIDVNFLTDEYVGNEQSYLIRRVFSLDLYQNEKLVDKTEIVSCDLEDPFLFQGYSIPGFDHKIMLLMSSDADCFEGGYISDSIYIINGLDNLDKTYAGSYKGITPIQPNKDTLIVFESEKVGNQESTSVNSDSIDDINEGASSGRFSQIMLGVFIGILSLLVGILFGKIISKKKSA